MTQSLLMSRPLPRHAVAVAVAVGVVLLVAFALQLWFRAPTELAFGRELRFWAWRAAAVAAVAGAQLLAMSYVLIPLLGRGRGDDVLRAVAGIVGCVASLASLVLFLAE